MDIDFTKRVAKQGEQLAIFIPEAFRGLIEAGDLVKVVLIRKNEKSPEIESKEGL